ncbi:hypothetical protein FA13DRAFT_1721978 [Coprinellus micaceus]|uniref:Uncharacterized protein n=1 Tax=Coprinellus micaceus TaxID=71717 RepID=A0A4Y7RSY1_COPMI|nr:hypothetical protein FA13DRAFT_1721978 [Coprinellus micaceus]
MVAVKYLRKPAALPHRGSFRGLLLGGRNVISEDYAKIHLPEVDGGRLNRNQPSITGLLEQIGTSCAGLVVGKLRNQALVRSVVMKVTVKLPSAASSRGIPLFQGEVVSRKGRYFQEAALRQELWMRQQGPNHIIIAQTPAIRPEFGVQISPCLLRSGEI